MVVTVFLLDDHEVVRRGLRELVEAEGDIVVVGESGSTQEAARRLPALRPDVAIFDARLPDGSGIDVCRDVRAADPAIKGLILTSYDDERALSAAVLAGASGYLLKDIRANGLVDAIRRVATGESLFDEAQLARLRADWRGGAGRDDPRIASLTPQERRVLDLIGAGLTNRQIGVRLSLAEKTVKNYVTSLLGKLGMGSRTQAAVYLATRPRPDRPRPDDPPR